MIGKKKRKTMKIKNQKKEKERKSNKSKRWKSSASAVKKRCDLLRLTGWSLAILPGCVGYAFLTRGRQPELLEGLQSFL